MSPNQRDPNKTSLHVYLPEDLYAKFKKYCKKTGLSMSDAITFDLMHKTADIELTAEDYEEITRKIRKRQGKL